MDQKPKGLLLITTGGTIAADSYWETPENVTFGYSDNRIVNAYVSSITGERAWKSAQKRKASGFNDHLTVGFNMQTRWVERGCKDSKDISPEEIQEIADMIVHSDEEVVLVTMGTDAMVRNAKMLQDALPAEVLAKKRIAFTGAHKPLTHDITHTGTIAVLPHKDVYGVEPRLKAGRAIIEKNRTDGVTNINDALTWLADSDDHGVRILMQRDVFEPDYTTKVYDEGADGKKLWSGRFKKIDRATEIDRA